MFEQATTTEQGALATLERDEHLRHIRVLREIGDAAGRPLHYAAVLSRAISVLGLPIESLTVGQLLDLIRRRTADHDRATRIADHQRLVCRYMPSSVCDCGGAGKCLEAV